jgi:hypothetical protein
MRTRLANAIRGRALLIYKEYCPAPKQMPGKWPDDQRAKVLRALPAQKATPNLRRQNRWDYRWHACAPGFLDQAVAWPKTPGW